MKLCSRCKQMRPPTDFYPDRRPGRNLLANCKKCNREKQQEYRRNHGPRVRTLEKTVYADQRWRNHLRRKYRLTADEYHALLASQHGKCAVCNANEPGGRTSRFHVDHDHNTGKVRGLLCTRCNQMLGYGRDKPDIFDAAAIYLRRSIVAPVAAEFIRAAMSYPPAEGPADSS